LPAGADWILIADIEDKLPVSPCGKMRPHWNENIQSTLRTAISGNSFRFFGTRALRNIEI
jgi:hypothetical protein